MVDKKKDVIIGEMEDGQEVTIMVDDIMNPSEDSDVELEIIDED